MKTLGFYKVTLNDNFLRLGRSGEDNVTAVIFDITDWVTELGPGTPVLAVQRPGESAPYPAKVVFNKEDNTVSWIIHYVDTALSGSGRAQLSYILDNPDGKKKSKIYSTRVEKSLSEACTEVPDTLQPWIDDILEAGSKVENAVVNPPKIGTDGYWYIWSFEKNQYVKTNVYAIGPKGDKGETGNTYFASFKVINGRLYMLSDPNLDKIKFTRKGSRLYYRLYI